MNQSYYIDGDSVIVTNEKGEMTKRDNLLPLPTNIK